MGSVILFTQVITWSLCLLLGGLFLWNLHRTVRAAQPANRAMKPWQVWLQLIPFFGSIFHFFVAHAIGKTIANEYQSKGHSLSSAKPTFGLGIVWAITNLFLGFFGIRMNMKFAGAMSNGAMDENAMMDLAQDPSFASSSMAMMLLSLGWLVLFITYWVQTANYRIKMMELPDNNRHQDFWDQYKR